MVKFTILWLDANSSDPQSTFHAKLGDARTFTDTDSCSQYVESHPNELFYLIVSGSLAKQFIPKVYERSGIIQIYIYCGSVGKYLEWAMDYCDKLLIFDHGDDLLERLWNDFYVKFQELGSTCLKLAEEYKQRALKYRQSCG